MRITKFIASVVLMMASLTTVSIYAYSQFEVTQCWDKTETWNGMTHESVCCGTYESCNTCYFIGPGCEVDLDERLAPPDGGGN